jgi:curved DNA-binding protein CbpA
MPPPAPSDPRSDRKLFDLLARLRERRSTGTLELTDGAASRRIHVRDGEVWIPGAHPLARKLVERLEAARRRQGAPMPADEPMLGILEKIAAVMITWPASGSRFRDGIGGFPEDLVGPLPGARLLMIGASLGLDEAEVDRRLGLLGARIRAAPGGLGGGDLLGFLPEEHFLFERLAFPTAVGELLAASPFPRAEAARRLLELSAVGLVLPESGAANAPASGFRDQAELVARLSERVAKGLAERPLELDRDTYREVITDLIARHGGLDHYELLAVSSDASVETIHAAFERLARTVHPFNAARFEITGSEPALRVLFERATLAWEVLSDPERRHAYNERQLIDLSSTAPSGERREAERRAIARGQFERALVYANAGDLHSAIQLLEQAVQVDPRADYWATLARLQARNPSWLRRALGSYKHAVQLDPANAELRLAYGNLFEQLDEPERARVQYNAALRASPDLQEAADRLQAVERRLTGATEPSPATSIFSRFFRRE